MSDSNQPITVTAQADRNFVILLNAYKHLKAIKKISLISMPRDNGIFGGLARASNKRITTRALQYLLEISK